jgi:hypothetical protein
MNTSEAINLVDVTTAALVCGRGFSLNRSTSEWEELFAHVDALAREIGLPLVAVVGNDFSSMDDVEEAFPGSGVIGLLVAATDDPTPLEVAWSSLSSAKERAASIPWERISTLVEASLEPELDVWLLATGPLAGGHVAFGVLARDESSGGPQAREPGLAFLAGKDMNQRRVQNGVWGTTATYTSDWAVMPLDVTPEAHEKRMKSLGSLGPEARYYLMSSFD